MDSASEIDTESARLRVNDMLSYKVSNGSTSGLPLCISSLMRSLRAVILE